MKLITSLTHAGASESTAEAIANSVEKEMRPNVHTGEIYRQAFALLRKHEPHGPPARYSLKRAIFDFGPSGFPFEGYVAELFRASGFEATTNVIAQGKCVEHEIDILTKKNGVSTYIEAKFHNTPGVKTDLKVVLYVQARMEDIRAKEGDAIRGMVLTNTTFTSVAERYATCAGLSLISWEYPQEHNLHSLITKTGLYPTTTLSTLTKHEKMALLGHKIVLCSSVLQHTEVLRNLGLSESRLNRVQKEVAALCGS